MLKSFGIFGLAILGFLSGAGKSALGMEFKVLGIHGEVLHQETVRVDLSRSVGALTIERLHASSMEFEGSESGIASIAGLGNQTARGADGALRYFGWCFSVQGEVPSLMPDRVKLRAQSNELTWFYGYAYQSPNGDWVQCHPADSRSGL